MSVIVCLLLILVFIFFFKQKTAYEMLISYWSSDVCSSDLHAAQNFAIKGYRVLLIDCDSQSSATTLFGYVPDLDLSEDDTLYPFLREGERDTLEYAIR